MSTGFVLNIDDKLLKNLERADELVQDIGKHSEQTRDKFNAAFQQMATGSLNDFISKLSEAKRAIADVGSANVQFNGVVNISNQAVKASDDIVNLVSTLAKLKHIMSQMGGENFSAEGLFNMGGATKDLTKELRKDLRATQRWMDKLKESTEAYENSIGNLSADLARAKEAQRSFNEEMKRASKQQAGGLINQQGQARTLNELKAYAKELQKTMANLDPKSSEWEKLNKIYKQTNREIKSINSSMKDMNNTHKSLINTADQLKRAFALVFSVSQIAGYVKNIARVRGEFELQQRSLQAILQNKDEADRLWQQTIQLAVRSPFQVKELVTYTKQLAAYRVESDKLYDTTKMLADVSAGLGVDMNRLILAYGQVKAANYLRGTELRQFSEAGVNILAELAKYFTELEGRAVSVGDVFERVSKRMVTFADVEEIFKRITSEGGVFYNMQEVQAETLKGQISNLRDAIDIMLNEIGKDNEGVLKGTVSTLRELVSSWREVEFYLSKVIVAYATYKGVVGIASLANSSLANGLLNIITKSDTATKVFDKLSNGIENVLSKLFKFPAAISGIKTLLGGLATLGVPAAIAAIVVGLMELWRRATKTTRELKALNKELEQIYSQDTKALDKQIKGFENLVNRLKTVNRGSREHKDIIGALNQNYGEYLGFIVDETTSYQRLEGSINAVNLALTNKAKLNTYEKAYGKVLEKNNEIISERQSTIKKQLEKVDVLKAGDIIQLNENEINDIFALFEKKVANAGRAGYDLAKEAFEEYGVGIEYGDIFNWGVFTEYGEAVLRNKEEEIKLQNKINSLYGGATASTIEMRQELERINAEEKNALANAETRRKKEEVRLKYAKERIDAEVKYEGLGADAAAKRYAELEKKSKTVIDVNEKIAKSVNKLGEKYAELIYIDDEQSAQGIDSIAKSAAESYELQNAIIYSQNKLKDAGTVYDKEALDNAKKSAEAYKYLLTLLGRTDLIKKSSNKTEDEATKQLKAQISLIKEMNKEYEKLRKEDSKIDALNKIREYFKGTAKSFGLDISESLFDDEGTKASLEKLLAKVPERLRPLVQKALDNVEVDIHFTAKDEQNKKLKQKVEDLFSRYDITLDLEKLDISKDLMSSLFDVESLDLSGLRRQVESLKDQFIGKDMEKEYQQYLDKIADMETKAQQERLKTYLNYARNAIGERAKIKLEELRKLADIEKTFDEGSPEKELAKQNVKEEAYQKTQKIEWEEFQKSDTFISLFKDLDMASSTLINHAIEKLNNFKDEWKNMPLEDMRSIVDKINQLEGQLVKINPFAKGRELKAEVKKDGRSVEQIQQDNINKEAKLLGYEQEIAFLEEILRLKQDGNIQDEFAIAAANNNEDVLISTSEEIAEQIQSKKDLAKLTRQDISNNNKALANQQQLKRSYSEQAAAIGDAQKMANDLIDSFSELAEVLGADGDGIGMTFVNMGQDMMNTVLNTIMLQAQLNAAAVAAGGLGVAMNTAMGVVGWIVMAVQLLVSLFSAVFKAHDKGLQNQIDKLAVQTEDLQEKFESLSESIDNAYNTDQLRTAAAEAKQYTQQMISNYEKMIALEEEKKKTDEDAVKEYEENIEAQKQELEDLQRDVISKATAGILDDTLSAARDFVDAWYDSFKEVDNGLNGLEDNFEEMFLNLAKQQATMQIAGRFAKQWEQDLSKYINEKDTELTKEDAQKWAEEVKATFPALNDALEGFLGVITEGVGATGELSGLQAGIQGISESQAEIISAYLNSLRFFVADNNSVMKQLRDYVVGTDDTANPMLAHLHTIAEQTSAMRKLLDSVTQSGHPKGQSGIRVFID